MTKHIDRVISFKAGSGLQGKIDELSKHFDQNKSAIIRAAIEAYYVEHLEPDKKYQDIKAMTKDLTRILDEVGKFSKDERILIKEGLRKADVMFIRPSTFMAEVMEAVKEEFGKKEGEDEGDKSDEDDKKKA